MVNGYTEHYTPYMVNADSMRGTGQFSKFEEEGLRVKRRTRGEASRFI